MSFPNERLKFIIIQFYPSSEFLRAGQDYRETTQGLKSCAQGACASIERCRAYRKAVSLPPQHCLLFLLIWQGLEADWGMSQGESSVPFGMGTDGGC